MTRAIKSAILALAACTLLAAAPSYGLAAADRTAEEILKDVDDVKRPELDPAKRNDRDYLSQYSKDLREANAKVSRLAIELFKAAPDHERVADLMKKRWTNPYLPTFVSADDFAKEVDDVLARTKDEDLKKEGLYQKARLLAAFGRDGLMDVVDAYAKLAPADPRLPALLFMAARGATDDARRDALEDRILKDFPESPYVKRIAGVRKQRSSIGKPFELEFTDAVKGTTISMKDLKGKVVVIDFWATWCGPCIAEMPKMKKLYAELAPKGVEFIGVSLDQPEDKGGLKALKEYVAKNEIAWPQYYQGNYWQSDFSSSWGVSAIPCVFLVDQDGKLYSVEARGKLEEMIPKLLDKAKGAAGGE